VKDVAVKMDIFSHLLQMENGRKSK